MATTEVRIAPLRVTMQAPLHVGTGFRRGLVHRTLVRDGSGNVYLPASTLKGKTRSTCEALIETLGLPRCMAPYPTAMHGHGQGRCLVCRVFGAPGAGPDLFWHDALLAYTVPPNTSHGQAMARTQVQLSRSRGVAAEAHLYTSEATSPGLVFEAKDGVAGRLELTPVPGGPQLWFELILLVAGLQLVRSLGGDASRGLGSCSIELPAQVQVGGTQVAVAGLLEAAEHLALWGTAEGEGNG